MIEHVIEGCQCQGKRCSKCKSILCVGRFSRQKHMKDGLRCQCKQCVSKDGKAYRDRPEVREHKHVYQTSPEARARDRMLYQERRAQILAQKRVSMQCPDIHARRLVYWQDYYS